MGEILRRHLHLCNRTNFGCDYLLRVPVDQLQRRCRRNQLPLCRLLQLRERCHRRRVPGRIRSVDRQRFGRIGRHVWREVHCGGRELRWQRCGPCPNSYPCPCARWRQLSVAHRQRRRLNDDLSRPSFPPPTTLKARRHPASSRLPHQQCPAVIQAEDRRVEEAVVILEGERTRSHPLTAGTPTATSQMRTKTLRRLAAHLRIGG